MKQETCTGCKHISNKDCGKMEIVWVSSGVIEYIKVPDKCKGLSRQM